MQKITKISIQNFKAYSHKSVFENPKGLNLLVYGENGSGKSSLFVALKYFMKTVTKPALNPDYNIYIGGGLNSEVELDLTDDSTGISTTVCVSSDQTRTNNHTFQYLKDASDSFGYLDYKRLLEFYLADSSNPELFNLIVLKLLGRYVFAGTGKKLSEEWDEINRLIFKSRTRATRDHKAGVAKLPGFSTRLRSLIREIKSDVNAYLDNEFDHMGIKILFDFNGKEVDDTANTEDIKFIGDRRKANWKLSNSLKIRVVNKSVATIPNIVNYTNNLNEARLSAIALCIYLASLKKMPQAIDFKLLVLDDVFIGIDTGNRLPILKLLNRIFDDYQIVLTTYDRSWFNMVKEYFENGKINDWKCFELYEGKHKLPSNETISKPIITESESEYSSALRYLHDEIHVNYPAAANYLRKSIEKTLEDVLPVGVLTNEDIDPIASYRLTTSVIKANDFFKQCFCFGQPFIDAQLAVQSIQNLLHPMIHPLSHHTRGIPVYKTELLEIVNALENIKRICTTLDIATNVVCKNDKNTKYLLTVKGRSGWEMKYELKTTENTYSYDGVDSATEIHVTRIIRQEPGKTQRTMPISSSNDMYNIMKYVSIDEALKKLEDYWKDKEETKDYQMLPNPRSMVNLIKADGSEEPLS